MAMATIPRRGGDDLRLCEKVYWGRSLQRTSTTCKPNAVTEGRALYRGPVKLQSLSTYLTSGNMKEKLNKRYSNLIQTRTIVIIEIKPERRNSFLLHLRAAVLQ